MFEIINIEDIKRQDADIKKLNNVSKKNMKKEIYSEAILENIVRRLPRDATLLIGEFLTYEVLNNLMSDNLYTKIFRVGDSSIISRFIECITSKPGFLRVLTREKAIQFVMKGGYYSQSVLEETNAFCKIYRPLYVKEMRAIIYTIITMAKTLCPTFAYKMLKIISVLNAKKNKFTFKFIMFPKLKITDLPLEYK